MAENMYKTRSDLKHVSVYSRRKRERERQRRRGGGKEGGRERRKGEKNKKAHAN